MRTGFPPLAQRLATGPAGYVPANGPTVRWGRHHSWHLPSLMGRTATAAPRSFRQLPVQIGSQRLANPTLPHRGRRHRATSSNGKRLAATAARTRFPAAGPPACREPLRLSRRRHQETPTAGTVAQPSRASTLPRPPTGPLLPPPQAPIAAQDFPCGKSRRPRVRRGYHFDKS